MKCSNFSFQGGPTRGRAPWRGGTDTYRERGHPDDEWQTARGSRRSYHDHEDVRWNERLPEWSNDDSDDFQTPGTFDSSGAFVSKVTLICNPSNSAPKFRSTLKFSLSLSTHFV